MPDRIRGVLWRIALAAAAWITLASLARAFDLAGWPYATYLLVAALAHLWIFRTALWISMPMHLQDANNAASCLAALVLFYFWPVIELDGQPALTIFDRQYGILAGSWFDRFLFAIVSLTEDILLFVLAALSGVLIFASSLNTVLNLRDGHRRKFNQPLMKPVKRKAAKSRAPEPSTGSGSTHTGEIKPASSADNPLDAFKV